MTVLQWLVDRRFNRARYDATRTVEAFAQRLRDQVHLPELTDELRSTVRRAIASATAAVWMPKEPSS